MQSGTYLVNLPISLLYLYNIFYTKYIFGK